MPLRNPSPQFPKGFASPLRASASPVADLTPRKPFAKGFVMGYQNPFAGILSILLYSSLCYAIPIRRVFNNPL